MNRAFLAALAAILLFAAFVLYGVGARRSETHYIKGLHDLMCR